MGDQQLQFAINGFFGLIEGSKEQREQVQRLAGIYFIKLFSTEGFIVPIIPIFMNRIFNEGVTRDMQTVLLSRLIRYLLKVAIPIRFDEELEEEFLPCLNEPISKMLEVIDIYVINPKIITNLKLFLELFSMFLYFIKEEQKQQILIPLIEKYFEHYQQGRIQFELFLTLFQFLLQESRFANWIYPYYERISIEYIKPFFESFNISDGNEYLNYLFQKVDLLSILFKVIFLSSKSFNNSEQINLFIPILERYLICFCETEDKSIFYLNSNFNLNKLYHFFSKIINSISIFPIESNIINIFIEYLKQIINLEISKEDELTYSILIFISQQLSSISQTTLFEDINWYKPINLIHPFFQELYKLYKLKEINLEEGNNSEIFEELIGRYDLLFKIFIHLSILPTNANELIEEEGETYLISIYNDIKNFTNDINTDVDIELFDSEENNNNNDNENSEENVKSIRKISIDNLILLFSICPNQFIQNLKMIFKENIFTCEISIFISSIILKYFTNFFTYEEKQRFIIEILQEILPDFNIENSPIVFNISISFLLIKSLPIIFEILESNENNEFCLNVLEISRQILSYFYSIINLEIPNRFMLNQILQLAINTRTFNEDLDKISILLLNDLSDSYQIEYIWNRFTYYNIENDTFIENIIQFLNQIAVQSQECEIPKREISKIKLIYEIPIMNEEELHEQEEELQINNEFTYKNVLNSNQIILKLIAHPKIIMFLKQLNEENMTQFFEPIFKLLDINNKLDETFILDYIIEICSYIKQSGPLWNIFLIKILNYMKEVFEDDKSEDIYQFFPENLLLIITTFLYHPEIIENQEIIQIIQYHMENLILNIKYLNFYDKNCIEFWETLGTSELTVHRNLNYIMITFSSIATEILTILTFFVVFGSNQINSNIPIPFLIFSTIFQEQFTELFKIIVKNYHLRTPDSYYSFIQLEIWMFANIIFSPKHQGDSLEQIEQNKYINNLLRFIIEGEGIKYIYSEFNVLILIKIFQKMIEKWPILTTNENIFIKALEILTKSEFYEGKASLLLIINNIINSKMPGYLDLTNIEIVDFSSSSIFSHLKITHFPIIVSAMKDIINQFRSHFSSPFNQPLKFLPYEQNNLNDISLLNL